MSRAHIKDPSVGEESHVRLLIDIYDDGDDHHPPCSLGRAGEVLIVRTLRKEGIGVSHEGIVDRVFVVFPGEYEPLSADAAPAIGSVAGTQEQPHGH